MSWNDHYPVPYLFKFHLRYGVINWRTMEFSAVSNVPGYVKYKDDPSGFFKKNHEEIDKFNLDELTDQFVNISNPFHQLDFSLDVIDRSENELVKARFIEKVNKIRIDFEKKNLPILNVESISILNDQLPRVIMFAKNYYALSIVGFRVRFKCYNVFNEPVDSNNVFFGIVQSEIKSGETGKFGFDLIGYSQTRKIDSLEIYDIQFADGSRWRIP